MKGPLLSAGEILDLAIQMEHRGVAFYGACTKASFGPPIVLVFEHLMAAEQNHARIFAEMKRRLAPEVIPEADSRNIRHYMEKLIGDRIAPETKRALDIVPEIVDPVEAVEIAIGFEKKSILLYSAMDQLIGQVEKEIIGKIVAEEHSHVRRLVDLLHELEN